jgi:transcriptional regulator with XRE-family HTH domain
MSISPRAWRLEHGLTLKQAADLAGVAGANPSRTWQRWERGTQRPPLTAVRLIESHSNGRVTIQSWLDLLGFNEGCSAASDDTAAHAGEAFLRDSAGIGEQACPAPTAAAGGAQ